MSELLAVVLDAMRERDEERRRADELEHRVHALLGDPDARMRAETWITLARESVGLLEDLAAWVRENPSVRDLLPSGYFERVTAQLHVLEITYRDQRALGEKPGQWWQQASGAHVVRPGD